LPLDPSMSVPWSTPPRESGAQQGITSDSFDSRFCQSVADPKPPKLWVIESFTGCVRRDKDRYGQLCFGEGVALCGRRFRGCGRACAERGSCAGSRRHRHRADRHWGFRGAQACQGRRSRQNGAMMMLVRSSSTSALQVSGASAIAFQKQRTHARTASCVGFWSPDRNRGR
jgi:hypothetical protein